MKRIILYLVCIQMFLLFTAGYGQIPCSSPPSCLSTATQHVPLNGAGWNASHGGSSVMISSSNSPYSTPGSGSLRFSSSLNMGNGAFTCYDFQASKTYRVCFWVRNNSGWPSNPFGRLYVHATKNQTYSGGSTLPSPTSILIDQSYAGPPQDLADWPGGEHEWEFISTTFTVGPTQSFNGLWFYALNPAGPPPPGPMQHTVQYVVEVDDIRVEEITGADPVFTTFPASTSISGCTGSATVTINMNGSPMPSRYVAIWTPRLVPPTPTGATATVKPCSTTTYKIEIIDTATDNNPFGLCRNCVRTFIYHTVTVNQAFSVANISYPTGIIPCMSKFTLDYLSPPSGCPVTYIWVDPHGNPYYGKTQPFTANATHSGEWTLYIVNPFKDCQEEHKFQLTVGSCCQSNPDFTIDPSSCNPLIFTQTGTGIINKKGSVWTFGDGTSSDQENPIHSYTTPGLKTICLTTLFEDEQGESCCSRKCTTVNVCNNPSPCAVVADFTTKLVPGMPNTFDFTDASVGNGTICSYEWTFPGGVVIVTTLPTYRYSFAGEGPWTVCLKVTNCVYNPNGSLKMTCTSTKCITIPPPPPPQQTTSVDRVMAFIPDIRMYPNPSNGTVTLKIGESVERDSSMVVTIKNMLGQDMGMLYSGPSFSQKSFKLPDITTGIYLVEIYSGGKVIYKENLSVE